jgi:alpha-D-ribose 1-methylphosphonate 5-triphosphate synthase subunit PhnL
MHPDLVWPASGHGTLASLSGIFIDSEVRESVSLRLTSMGT